jgi:predicted transcriptional regulator
VRVDNNKGLPSPGKIDPIPPTEKDVGTPELNDPDDPTAQAAVVTITVVILGLIIGGVEASRFALLKLLFVPLYTRIKKDRVLDNFTRGMIYGFIVANPGAHYNLIKQELKLNNGAVIYHLDILEREGFITSDRVGIYRRFFAKGKKSSGPMEKLTEIQHRILTEIMENPGISQKEIANKLKMTARALNYHIKAMIKKELVRLERHGRRTKCYNNTSS